MKKLFAFLTLLLLPSLVQAQGIRIAPPGASAVTASSTTTFTNKTLDCEATGNVCTIPEKKFFPAAGGTAAAPASVWNLPATNPAVPVCTAGTNKIQCTLDFADGANELTAQTDYWLPADFSGTVDAKFLWYATPTSGDVKWKIYTACPSPGAVVDATWNSASTVTTTVPGTTLQLAASSITTVDITGCVAGDLLSLKVGRDPADGADTMAGTARLVGIELTLRRAM